MKQLIGHTSPETAYVVADYPYGFKLRTSIRYWIETKKNHGQRYVSQTLNPKTGKWNKPKASTYDDVVVMGLNEDNHVSFRSASFAYHEAWQLEDFASSYTIDEAVLHDLEKYIRTKKAYAAKKAAYKAEHGVDASYVTCAVFAQEVALEELKGDLK